MNPDARQFKTCPKCGYERNSLQAKQCEICGFALKGLKVPPIAWLALAALLAGGAYYAYRQNLIPGLTPSTVTSNPGTVPTAAPTALSQNPTLAPAAVAPGSSTPVAATNASLLSQGERLLIRESTSPEKEAGITAFARQDFSGAATQLTAATTALRSDPETRIYLNNAQIGSAPAVDIAVVVPISNSVNPAREILRGIAQAQTTLNQNRGTALPVRVWIADDQNNPSQAQSIAQTIVNTPQLLGVVGHGTSATSVAAAPIYRQGQKVMIAPTSTSTELAQTDVKSGSPNFIFRTIPSDQFTGTALARYTLTKLNKKQVTVFFNSGSSYSMSLKNAFATTLTLEGGQVVQEVDLSQGDPTTALTNTASQALVLLSDASTFPAAMQVAKANKGRLPLLGGDALYRIDSLKEGGSAINGLVLPVPWHPLRSGDPQFPAAAQKLWGGEVNWRTAMAYDATLALAKAIQRSTNPVTSAEVATILTTIGFSVPGVTGSISFTPSGERLGQVLLVQVKPGSLSKTGYDFVPLP